MLNMTSSTARFHAGQSNFLHFICWKIL